MLCGGTSVVGLYALAASDAIDKLETPMVDLAFKLHNVLGADKLIMLVPLSIGRYASITISSLFVSPR